MGIVDRNADSGGDLGLRVVHGQERDDIERGVQRARSKQSNKLGDEVQSNLEA